MKKLPFWLHCIIALVLGALILLGLIYALDSYTGHGNTTEVPEVTKKKLPEALKALEAQGFSVVVDSTYTDTLPPLYVIKQFPDGGDRVKTGRTIQLIVNKGTPPTVEMPALLGVSVTSALQYLKRSNLKLGDTLYKPDFAVGRILQQLANGTDVKSGTLLPYGTKITLVIGSGLGGEVSNYPDFYGMTLKQAYTILDTLGLSRGAIVVDKGTKDSLQAYIYKQNPPVYDPLDGITPTRIMQGNVVEFWVSDVRKPREVDTTMVKIDDASIDELKLKDGATPGTTPKPKPKKPKPKSPATTPEPPKPEVPKPDDGYGGK